MKDDLLSVLDALPPYMVRLVALDGSRPMSTAEIAEKSGLSKSTIKTLARSQTWLNFELSTIIKFTNACGIDLLHQKRPRFRLKRMAMSVNGPPHIHTEQRKYWESIMTGEKEWRKKI